MAPTKPHTECHPGPRSGNQSNCNSAGSRIKCGKTKRRAKRGLGCGAYLRYVDDLLLFSDSKYVLWDWLAAIDNRLATLRVTRHPGIHPRRVTDGIPFLGFVIFPHKRRLKRRKGLHFQRKLAGMLREDPLDLERLEASVQGWTNHVRYGNTVGLREAVLARYHQLGETRRNDGRRTR